MELLKNTLVSSHINRIFWISGWKQYSQMNAVFALIIFTHKKLCFQNKSDSINKIWSLFTFEFVWDPHEEEGMH